MNRCVRYVCAGLVVALMFQVEGAAFAQDVVGRIGTLDMRVADLKRLIDAQSPEVRKQLSTDLGALDQVVRKELVRQSVLTEARQQGWDKRPEVQAQIERAREQVVLQAYMNSMARPPATYPSEEEIKAFYEATKANLSVPPEIDLAQIFFAAPDTMDKAAAGNAQKKAGDAAARLQKAPGEFGKLARESSEHKESAAKNGELGWLPEPQLIPEVRAAALRMTKGEISSPIRSTAGWHIIRLNDRKASTARSLPEVRDQIVQTMRLRKAQEVERKYLEDLVGKTPVTVNQVELQKLQATIK